MNWILKNVFESIWNLMDGITEKVIVAVDEVYLDAAKWGYENQAIKSIEAYLAGIAFTLLALVVMKRVFSTYIMEVDGDPDSSPLQLIMLSSVAIALIANNSSIYGLLLGLSESTGKILRDKSLFDGKVNDPINNLWNIIQNKIGGGIVNIDDGLKMIYLLIFIIGTLILCIKGAIRGAELCLMYILFPLFCCDLISSRRERFNAFITAYVVTFLGYLMQLLCFRVSGYLFGASNVGEGINDLLVSYAFLYMAIKTPKWLDKFVYSTGLGQSVGNGARSAAFMAPSLLRMLPK